MRRLLRRPGRIVLALLTCAVVAGCSGGEPTAPNDGTGGARASWLPIVGAGRTGGTGGTAPTRVAVPADLGPRPSASCSPDLAPGWLARENARGGAVRLRTTRTSVPAHIYLDTVSAVCGQSVGVAASAQPGVYRLRVVRAGWYGGAGGRVIATSGRFAAASQTTPADVAQARTPGWRRTTSLVVGPSWEPGFYVVQLIQGSAPDGPVLTSAPLVVLAPPAARRAPALFVVSAMTWTAYTDYGGRSLYRSWQGNLPPAEADKQRARVADIARPTEGPGVYTVYRYTASLVRAVERAGVDVDYAADLDVDAYPSLLGSRAEIVTGTHTEYVTRRIYDAFEAARAAGTNLAFLGGNQFYWQARVERDGDQRPLSVTVYRVAADDPLASSQPALTTVRWRRQPLSRPEAGLIGAQYTGLGVVAPLAVLDPPAWLGWRRGDVIPAGAASEVDAVQAGASPQGTQVVAAGGGVVKGRDIMATVTYYVAGSGAGVFDAASVFVACSTTNTCETVRVPPATGALWLDTIGRVVRLFATPRFGATHPADPRGTAVPTYASLLHAFGPRVAGAAIKGED